MEDRPFVDKTIHKSSNVIRAHHTQNLVTCSWDGCAARSNVKRPFKTTEETRDARLPEIVHENPDREASVLEVRFFQRLHRSRCVDGHLVRLFNILTVVSLINATKWMDCGTYSDSPRGDIAHVLAESEFICYKRLLSRHNKIELYLVPRVIEVHEVVVSAPWLCMA